MLSQMPINVVGVVIGIDRMEKGPSGKSAAEEISSTFHVPIHALLNLDDIVSALWNNEVLGKIWIDDDLKAKIDSYREQYCATT